MFTGLIKEVAIFLNREDAQGGLRIEIERPKNWTELELGESIALNGICLTLTEFNENKIVFFVGLESLAKTNIQAIRKDQKVNLERSLALGDRLGGHLVSGHVDGAGLVMGKEIRGDCLWLKIHINENLIRWVVPKGSIALNGVSLTVNELDRKNLNAEFLLIPETLERTNLKDISEGEFINIECDQMVKIIAEQVKYYGVINEHHP
ncbi:MAG: riboflavin synthase [Oligoflexia bacterium]|nr:riboflavin synthase [Oligoflexia bacterium]